MPEVTEPTFASRTSTSVSYGVPFAPLTKTHLDRLGAKTVFIFVSASLHKNHPEQLDALRKELGDDRIVGEKIGIAPHSPWSEILEVSKQVSKCNPQAFITLGGGSVCDATKVLALVDSNRPKDGEYTFEYLETLASHSDKKVELNAPVHPIICIPTTLSAAEYSSFAGAVDDRTHHKRGFGHADGSPKVVILDPALAKLTPEWVWISTGVRSIDHCVETICSQDCDESAEKTANEGLSKLVSGLLASKTATNTDSEEARLKAHLGARLAMDAPCRGISMGGSHGIGHQLGTYNVAHGHTSCVLCPWVMRYNKSVNEPQQKKALDAIWGCGEPVAEILKRRGLSRETADLSDVLDAVFRELGMPRSLKEVGVGEDKFEELAIKSLEDRWAQTNPIPLVKKEQVIEILNLAA